MEPSPPSSHVPGTPRPESLHVSVQSAGGGAGGAGGDGGGGGTDGMGGGGGVDGGIVMPRVVISSVAPMCTLIREKRGRPISCSIEAMERCDTTCFAWYVALSEPSMSCSAVWQPGGGGGGGLGGDIRISRSWALTKVSSIVFGLLPSFTLSYHGDGGGGGGGG